MANLTKAMLAMVFIAIGLTLHGCGGGDCEFTGTIQGQSVEYKYKGSIPDDCCKDLENAVSTLANTGATPATSSSNCEGAEVDGIEVCVQGTCASRSM
mmetsp:Transcript_44132/g.82873  ORF Transcript_44132/g.82873 Transcript_44132/m.82873 type:complete len:98 (+) Transcript_44132:129-422(+)